METYFEYSSFTAFSHKEHRQLIASARLFGWTLDQVSTYADGTILSHLSRARRR